ncbi:UNVERIFIED_ORG: PepSY-associated transmembrane protein [Zoogloea ramigera]|uniref:PepSY-associated TM helix domain-containing protein n=1 Tax=Duganella zoogloeoides TaxID=75659 RepID=A0ABZ0XSQ7_9BURK|nr:PepSY-associated TM helix domain-containing protein [Duganella zoogloeoides]WQH02709.1 PepSY-associated TM helix domain-containing protein [Duganella zoogloeoides]
MRRILYLIHRWTGIAMCALMALWFVSGMVMLFVGYPKLTPAERLAALPLLAADCCIEPAQALARSHHPAAVQAITLTSIAGRAHYQLLEQDGRTTQVDAATGALAPKPDAQAAVTAARMFKPGAPARYAGLVEEDRWTHSRGLNPHRPLHVVELDDDAATRVYVSSATGQVMLDAPRAERYWNFAGAWLHWLYMLRQQNTDPVWTWTLIGLSAVGVLSAVTGMVNGVQRWRFKGRYKSGARTPYREFAMRWHHVLGLGFGLVLCTWMFSGLMSMNPLGVFNARGAKPDAAAMQGGAPASVRLTQPVVQVLALLHAQSFAPRELEWRVLGGAPFIVARDGHNDTRIVVAGGHGLTTAKQCDTQIGITCDDGLTVTKQCDTRISAICGDGLTVTKQWEPARLEAVARKLLPYPVSAFELVTKADAYYYQRGDASMYGGNERRLPALRVVFDDPGHTWVYLDAATGQVALSIDSTQRIGRWLFNFLHSWDVPAWLSPVHGAARIAVLIALSAGGLLLSATAVVIAARRLRRMA